MCLDTNESLSNYPSNDICQRMFVLLNRKSLFILQHQAMDIDICIRMNEWMTPRYVIAIDINLEIKISLSVI